MLRKDTRPLYVQTAEELERWIEGQGLDAGARLPSEAQLAQQPDGPFGWVELPGFHAVPVVVLKFMMIIMIAFTESEERHNPTVPSRTVRRVGARA